MSESENKIDLNKKKSNSRLIFYTLAALLVLFLFWLFRPGEEPPKINKDLNFLPLEFELKEADEAIRKGELAAGPLKPDNLARIVWHPDYRQKKAPCSIVYLHGYSASHGEGSPLHTRVARDLGCHLYLSRLHDHGLRTEQPLLNMHPDSLMKDAHRALSIGNLLGEEVVLIGNSMGGTLAIYLAATHPESVDALVLFAPMIEFGSELSILFDRPWGQRLMRLILGEPFVRASIQNDGHARYWYRLYRTESLMVLKELIEELMTEPLFQKIEQPVFTGYFFKNNQIQDQVASVPAIKRLEKSLGTEEGRRVFKSFPEADAHVISSAYRTREYDEVRKAVVDFLHREGIGLPK